MEISDKEAPNRSVDDLNKISKKDQDSVTSDKEYNYQDLNKYRTHTDAFDVVFPDNGILSYERWCF